MQSIWNVKLAQINFMFSNNVHILSIYCIISTNIYGVIMLCIFLHLFVFHVNKTLSKLYLGFRIQHIWISVNTSSQFQLSNKVNVFVGKIFSWVISLRMKRIRFLGVFFVHFRGHQKKITSILQFVSIKKKWISRFEEVTNISSMTNQLILGLLWQIN